MSLRVYIPRDSAALAVGADEVAAALAKAMELREQNPSHQAPDEHHPHLASPIKGEGHEGHREKPSPSMGEGWVGVMPPLAPQLEIIRTGSRGLYWLEPMVEVETPAGRIAYGPVEENDVDAEFISALIEGAPHPLRLGRPEDIPFLKRQTRLVFARCGIVDPLSLDDYCAHGGYRGLERALLLTSAGIVDQVTKSGLRGRGGAGFPTGIKWKTVLDTPAGQKYIVCNADEGDSGTFADRMIMEGDPFVLIEGMTIAGIAVGATRGYVYIRSEYPDAIAMMERAIETARQAGYLGAKILDSAHTFDLEVRVGAGAYVCGEETSLLESLEGRRGQVRAKPPLPAHKGLFGRPTVINNVISLASVPVILAEGAEHFCDFGMGRSRGTMPIQLAGNISRGGLFETAFGLTLGELVNEIGGGTASGRPVRAVQVGGPLGAYFPPALFDTPFDYEAFAAKDGLIGHGGIVVFDDTVDMLQQARFAMEFCAIESCGKCTPCRIGSTRGVEVLDRISRGERLAANRALIADLCQTLKFGSLCALGGFTPYPVLSALNHFPEDFVGRVKVAA